MPAVSEDEVNVTNGSMTGSVPPLWCEPSTHRGHADGHPPDRVGVDEMTKLTVSLRDHMPWMTINGLPIWQTASREVT